MGKNMFHVQVNEEICAFEEGTTYQQIAEKFQEQYEWDIVGVFVNDKLEELHKKLKADCELRFVTTADSIGHKTYERSMCMLLVKAIFNVCDYGEIETVRIHFPVSKGLYCTVKGDVTLDQAFLDRVTARMKEIADIDMPIEKRTINTEDAIALFGQHGMYDKEKLFQYRRVSKVNVYYMNDFEDYFYGHMVPSARYLKYFKLYLYDEGFVIQLPDQKAPTTVPEFRPEHKQFQVLKQSVKWGDMQGIETVGDLNEKITKQGFAEVVLVQEALQEKKIAEIATQISSNPNIKFILIAGPSSSGKTTFSHRLSVQLRANGLIPHPIAVDNYFVEREDTPRDEKGEYDFEALECVDLELFNSQMQDLIDGKEVLMPTFNFVTGKKEYNGQTKKLGPNDVLVIEGIHCLNPKMTELLANENKFKIYISALTQLNIDEHNCIPTTDGRLLRRMVRDVRTRGTDPQKTIRMWESVRRGEEKNIFPYQEEADVVFNSTLIYELAVLKPYIEARLFGMDKECPEWIEAKRLLKFLDYFIGIGSEYVPTNSLLREFVGGGCFKI